MPFFKKRDNETGHLPSSPRHLFVNETRGGKVLGALWLKEGGKSLQILTVIMMVLAKDPVISRLPLVTNLAYSI